MDIEDVIDDEEYEEAICEMKTEHAKKRGKNHSRIKQLMETTRGRRKKWITEDSPLTSQILQKFPLLSSTKTVSLYLLTYVPTVRLVIFVGVLISRFSWSVTVHENSQWSL